MQEDLCFATWRPSTGATRQTALIDDIVLPQHRDRELHGNTSFNPSYLLRALDQARKQKKGLAFMHSHPSPGWQGMSTPDIAAERDIIALPVRSTGLPLVGLTSGSDGYWSARWWHRDGSSRKMIQEPCKKVRVVGARSYGLYFDNILAAPPQRRDILRRTYDAWGSNTQANISRLHVGIIGLGSVGAVVAEIVARLGIVNVTLIDPDHVKEHNLDRLLNASTENIGELKVNIAARAMERSTTAEKPIINVIARSLQEKEAYSAALDCDVLFSCVDRPIARDILNHIANAHLIPVIDSGVALETSHKQEDQFGWAQWRTYLVTPGQACLRCVGQYTSSMVVAEQDGSLDSPSYINSLPPQARVGNQNVFPFSVNVASMAVNMMLRYVLAQDWWPELNMQNYQLLLGEIRVAKNQCHANCSFIGKHCGGDSANPAHLLRPGAKTLPQTTAVKLPWWHRILLTCRDYLRR